MNLFERVKKIKLYFPTREEWEDSTFERRFRVLLAGDYVINDKESSIRILCKRLIKKYFSHHYRLDYPIINFDCDASYNEAIQLMDLLLKYTKNWIYS